MPGPYLAAPGTLNLWVGPLNPFSSNSIAISVVANNHTQLMAFQVSRPVTVSTARLRVGTASGNMSVAIYSADGTRLATTGAVAVPTAAINVGIALTAPVTLYPGVKYFAGVSADNTTAAFGGFAAAAGIAGADASDDADIIGNHAGHPAPASLTLANIDHNAIAISVRFV